MFHPLYVIKGDFKGQERVLSIGPWSYPGRS
jgi:hypothetical protein